MRNPSSSMNKPRCHIKKISVQSLGTADGSSQEERALSSFQDGVEGSMAESNQVLPTYLIYSFRRKV